MSRDEEVVASAAAQLSKLAPGPLPFEVFLQIARLSVTPVIEIVPVRQSPAASEGVQVLMLRRPTNDPVWGGLLHTPGTVIRTTDRSLEDGLARISSDELGNPRASSPVFVQNFLHRQARGPELALVYWMEIQEDTGIGDFVDLSNMPTDIVKTQLEFIQPACAAYLSGKGPLTS